jgi:membrane fusion protein, multidrug efflux system
MNVYHFILERPIMSTQHSQADHTVLSAVPSAAPAAPAKAPPNRRVLLVAGLIALVALGAGGRMWWRGHYFVETENAYVSGHVHPLSARVAGVVTRVLVEDNQVVRAGDVTAELDPTDQRLKVEQIQAQIDSAEQQVLQAEAQGAQVRAQAGAAAAQVLQ